MARNNEKSGETKSNGAQTAAVTVAAANAAANAAATAAVGARAAGRAQPPIKWNTAALHSSYANFCNANSTREEVVLNFGVNKSWERGGNAADALEIDLNHRIVLSPFAAKRLTALMQQLMKEYETRYGVLSE
jgi:hypothetical protein